MTEKQYQWLWYTCMFIVIGCVWLADHYPELQAGAFCSAIVALIVMIFHRVKTDISAPPSHDMEDVYEEFKRIDQGVMTNVSFSHANVVMISKELYATYGDAVEYMMKLRQKSPMMYAEIVDDSQEEN